MHWKYQKFEFWGILGGENWNNMSLSESSKSPSFNSLSQNTRFDVLIAQTVIHLLFWSVLGKRENFVKTNGKIKTEPRVFSQQILVHSTGVA